MLKILLQLIFSFLQIGLFSIGGGYATIPLIKEQVVDIHNWLSLKSFTDIITISQMTPGPLAVNTSTFVGIQVAGVIGAILATLSCIFFGFIISISLYKFFEKHKDSTYVTTVLNGLKSTSTGLIASSALTILLIAFLGASNSPYNLNSFNVYALIIFIIAFVILRKYKLNPIYVIIISGVMGFLVY